MVNTPGVVGIGVCTYRRPHVLDGLLRKLVGEAASISAAGVRLIVVDDDVEASAEAVAESYRERFTAGVDYQVTGSRNIAAARNRVLDCAIDRVDLLALIDDDCLPDEGWLGELLSVHASSRSELVSGRCIDVAPPDSPRWLDDFLWETPPQPNGTVMGVGSIKNTLVSTEFLRDSGLRFELEWGRIGCEDVMFYYRAAAAGVVVRYAEHAVVREMIPPGRATTRYQLRRRLWYGCSESLSSVAAGRYSRRRMGASGLKKALVASLDVARHLAQRRTGDLRVPIGEVLRGLGRVVGALGIKVPHR